MRVLVTGAAGFVGAYAVQALLDQGHAVTGLVREGDVPSHAGVRYLTADITVPAQINDAVRKAQPQAVIHLAGITSVRQSWEQPELTMNTNCLGTVHLLDAVLAAELEPVILTVGSAEEYGMAAAGPEPVREDGGLRPVNPYGTSKLAQGQLALQYAKRHHLRVIHARPFNHTGPGQQAGLVLADWAKQIAAAEAGRQHPLLRVGNLDVRRDFMHVRDVVDAYLLLLERGTPGEVYNVASGNAYDLREILTTLLALAQVAIRWEQDPALMRPADVPLMWGDAAKLRALGWSPTYDLAGILGAVLDDWRRRSNARPLS